MLHHTESIENAVREVFRVLRPGGEALISMYYKYSWKILLAKFARINFEFVHEDAPITRLYTKKEMRRLFARFQNVQAFRAYTKATKSPRTDGLARLFNNLFVPTYNLLPGSICESFGHRIVAIAKK